MKKLAKRVTCLLNPENVVMRRVAGIRPRLSIGGSLTGAELADHLSENEHLLFLEREQAGEI